MCFSSVLRTDTISSLQVQKDAAGRSTKRGRNQPSRATLLREYGHTWYVLCHVGAATTACETCAFDERSSRTHHDQPHTNSCQQRISKTTKGHNPSLSPRHNPRTLHALRHHVHGQLLPTTLLLDKQRQPRKQTSEEEGLLRNEKFDPG